MPWGFCCFNVIFPQLILPTRCAMGLMWLLPNWCDLNHLLVCLKHKHSYKSTQSSRWSRDSAWACYIHLIQIPGRPFADPNNSFDALDFWSYCDLREGWCDGPPVCAHALWHPLSPLAESKHRHEFLGCKFHFYWGWPDSVRKNSDFHRLRPLFPFEHSSILCRSRGEDLWVDDGVVGIHQLYPFSPPQKPHLGAPWTSQAGSGDAAGGNFSGGQRLLEGKCIGSYQWLAISSAFWEVGEAWWNYLQLFHWSQWELCGGLEAGSEPWCTSPRCRKC